MELPKIYLIRHGETAWSLSGQHTGLSDIPLTAGGEEQARRLSEPLGKIKFTRVFSSPLQRASRTCALAGFEAVVEVEPLLSEWSYGEYEGITSAEIRKTRPDWNIFRDGGPGGESPEQVMDRAKQIIVTLKGCSGNILIFSHSHFLRVLAMCWVGWPITSGDKLLLDTASLSILSFNHRRTAEPAIQSWNVNLLFQ